MKSGTYSKNGKGKIDNNNLKKGKNLMKTVAYKKTDKGIVKISNKTNSLEDMVLIAYNRLYKEISSKRYTFGHDSLQNAITAIWSRLEAIKGLTQEEIYKYLVKACSNKEIDEIRQSIRYNLLKESNLDRIENIDSGITEVFIAEVMHNIKRVLTDREYQLFYLYHIKGLTQKEIAKKFDSYEMSIHRRLEVIGKKIDSLKVNYLFDTFYVSWQSHKKRRYCRYADYKEDSGLTYKIDKSKYEPIKKEPIKINPNKCLQYPTKKYFEASPFVYMNDGRNNFEFVSGVYANSQLPIPENKIGYKEYRRKRHIRKYVRGLKRVKKEDITFELFDGHKSYLYKDGIQD